MPGFQVVGDVGPALPRRPVSLSPKARTLRRRRRPTFFALSRVAGVHSVAVMVRNRYGQHQLSVPVLPSSPFRPLTPRQRPPYPRTATAHLQVLPPPMTEHLRSDIKAARLIADGRAGA